MPKAASTKKPAAKKTAAKKTTRRTTVKSAVAKKAPVVSAISNTSSASKGLTAVIVLLIVVVLLQVIGLFGGEKASSEIEVLKAGGEENFEKLMELYESDKYVEFQEKSIEAMKNGIENPEAAPTPAPSGNAPAAAPSKEMSADKAKEIIAAMPIKGNADAEIVIIEYSDIECPFCARHYTANTLGQVVDKFDGKVAKSFQHFPLSFHPNAEPAAIGAECVRDELGVDAFYSYLDAIFASKDFTTNGILAAGTEAGADIQTCLDNKDFASEVQAQMSQGQSTFGVSGTPGNIVINQNTGKRELVSGAQGVAAFEAAVNRLLE